MLRLGATSISRLSSKEGRQGEDPLISLVGMLYLYLSGRAAHADATY